MEVLQIVLTALISLTLIVLVIGVFMYVKRLDKAISDIQQTLGVVREEIVPLAAEVRKVVASADDLISDARGQSERVKRIITAVEQLLNGQTITKVAGSAVTQSRTTMVVALEGLKQGLKAFLGSRAGSKEESRNEERE